MLRPYPASPSPRPPPWLSLQRNTHATQLRLLRDWEGGALTFSCVVGQDGTGSRLLALRVLSGAGVGAVGPGGPGTQGAVLGTGHLADERHGQDGVTAQLLFHVLVWRRYEHLSGGSTIYLVRKGEGPGPGHIQPQLHLSLFIHTLPITKILQKYRQGPETPEEP